MQQEQLLEKLEELFAIFSEYEKVTQTSFLNLVDLWVHSFQVNEVADENSISFYNAVDRFFSQNALSNEDKRRIWQYILLRVQEASGRDLELTPDVICVFIAYLMKRFTGGKIVSIMDPAVGTANLLTAVLNELNESEYIDIYGIDAQKSILSYAAVNSELQKRSIEFIFGDYLAIQLPVVHIMVCDLPVGYYPNKEISKAYQLNRTKTLAYSHELYLEKMLSHVQEGGYLFLLIPNHLFERDKTKAVHQLILSQAYIYGLLELPNELFQKTQERKSIFILRKKGEGIYPVEQIMMVQIPSFQNEECFQNILIQMNQWFKEQLILNTDGGM